MSPTNYLYHQHGSYTCQLILRHKQFMGLSMDGRSYGALLMKHRRVGLLYAYVVDRNLETFWLPPNRNVDDDYGGWAVVETWIKTDKNKGFPKFLFVGIGVSVAILLAAIGYYSLSMKAQEVVMIKIPANDALGNEEWLSLLLIMHILKLFELDTTSKVTVNQQQLLVLGVETLGREKLLVVGVETPGGRELLRFNPFLRSRIV